MSAFGPESLLIDFYEKCYRPRRLRNRNQNTHRLYKLSIELFAKVLERRPTLADLTDDNMVLVLQRMTDEGLSVASRNKQLWQIGAIHRFANQCGAVTTWPTIKPETNILRTPTAWLKEDLVRIFESIKMCRGHYGEIPRSLWFEVLVRVFLETGERYSAVMACEWTWLENEYLHIRGEVRKGRRSDAMYKLSPGLLGLLNEMKNLSTETRIFWAPLKPKTIWKSYGEILKRAGLPHGQRDKFHRFRRTVASVLDASNVSATNRLGHSRESITQNHYLDPRFKSVNETCDVMNRWLTGVVDESASHTHEIVQASAVRYEPHREPMKYDLRTAFKQLGYEVPQKTICLWANSGCFGIKPVAEMVGKRRFITMAAARDFIRKLAGIPGLERFRIRKESRVPIVRGRALCDW